MNESLVISATALNPTIDQRNDNVYKNALFTRDDQIFDTLAAGINAGQHEGGGKSLEIRRFGFNLDHGGVNGGLKVLVDDVQQNQATQGHGQGYLGALKTLTPELVDDVGILNGLPSVEYGDFSGPVSSTFGSRRACLVFDGPHPGRFVWRLSRLRRLAPRVGTRDTFLAYEGSRTDGPFTNPEIRPQQHHWQLHASPTKNFNRHQIEFRHERFLLLRTDPVDLVDGGGLNRFGFIDPLTGAGLAQST